MFAAELEFQEWSGIDQNLDINSPIREHHGPPPVIIPPPRVPWSCRFWGCDRNSTPYDDEIEANLCDLENIYNSIEAPQKTKNAKKQADQSFDDDEGDRKGNRAYFVVARYTRSHDHEKEYRKEYHKVRKVVLVAMGDNSDGDNLEQGRDRFKDLDFTLGLGLGTGSSIGALSKVSPKHQSSLCGTVEFWRPPGVKYAEDANFWICVTLGLAAQPLRETWYEEEDDHAPPASYHYQSKMGVQLVATSKEQDKAIGDVYDAARRADQLQMPLNIAESFTEAVEDASRMQDDSEDSLTSALLIEIQMFVLNRGMNTPTELPNGQIVLTGFRRIYGCQ
ncbi:hypothetical protein CONLIGDRAFT_676475 [Coniochaeta ligniaria NRRL 30616]|uniref:Uncharacterized protein n=1 Tax=Coniochaeta ligniaria NRRL 30616 TaxID=1408157 RepID=A0A1J7JZH5_9PEZI|nr:hypothetical protein CONLIGDRAFT_676475 [Coniochaeta ligniaria NRRL 30616]